MNSRWTQHLKTAEERKNFTNLVKNSRSILDRLDDIVQEEIDTLQRKKVSEDGWNNPNWPYLQAHYLGQIKALLRLKELTKLKEVK